MTIIEANQSVHTLVRQTEPEIHSLSCCLSLVQWHWTMSGAVSSDSDTSCQILVSACYELAGNCPERSGQWPLMASDHWGWPSLLSHLSPLIISILTTHWLRVQVITSGWGEKNNLRLFLNGCLLFRLIPSWSLMTEESHDSGEITSCIKAKYTLTHTHNIQSVPRQIERLKVTQKFYQGSYFPLVDTGPLSTYVPVTLSPGQGYL